MPYVSNESGLERLQAACAAHGMTLAIAGVWWRHRGALEAAWVDMGWENIDPTKTVGSFDLGGGCVGWFRKFVNHAGFDVWSLECVSPAGLAEWPAGRTCSPTQLRIGLNVAVNQHLTPKKEKPRDPDAPANHLGLEPGARVACVARNGRGFLGIAETVDDEGRVVTVRLSPDGGAEDAAEYSRVWFGVKDNDAGFDKLWNGGRREFANYYSLRSAVRSPRIKADAEAKKAAAKVKVRKGDAAATGAVDIMQTPAWLGHSADTRAAMESEARGYVATWLQTGQVAKGGEAAALQHAAKWVLEMRNSQT